MDKEQIQERLAFLREELAKKKAKLQKYACMRNNKALNQSSENLSGVGSTTVSRDKSNSVDGDAFFANCNTSAFKEHSCLNDSKPKLSTELVYSMTNVEKDDDNTVNSSVTRIAEANTVISSVTRIAEANTVISSNLHSYLSEDLNGPCITRIQTKKMSETVNKNDKEIVMHTEAAIESVCCMVQNKPSSMLLCNIVLDDRKFCAEPESLNSYCYSENETNVIENVYGAEVSNCTPAVSNNFNMKVSSMTESTVPSSCSDNTLVSMSDPEYNSKSLKINNIANNFVNQSLGTICKQPDTNKKEKTNIVSEICTADKMQNRELIDAIQECPVLQECDGMSNKEDNHQNEIDFDKGCNELVSTSHLLNCNELLNCNRQQKPGQSRKLRHSSDATYPQLILSTNPKLSTTSVSTVSENRKCLRVRQSTSISALRVWPRDVSIIESMASELADDFSLPVEKFGKLIERKKGAPSLREEKKKITFSPSKISSNDHECDIMEESGNDVADAQDIYETFLFKPMKGAIGIGCHTCTYSDDHHSLILCYDSRQINIYSSSHESPLWRLYLSWTSDEKGAMFKSAQFLRAPDSCAIVVTTQISVRKRGRGETCRNQFSSAASRVSIFVLIQDKNLGLHKIKILNSVEISAEVRLCSLNDSDMCIAVPYYDHNDIKSGVLWHLYIYTIETHSRSVSRRTKLSGSVTELRLLKLIQNTPCMCAFGPEELSIWQYEKGVQLQRISLNISIVSCASIINEDGLLFMPCLRSCNGRVVQCLLVVNPVSGKSCTTDLDLPNSNKSSNNQSSPLLPTVTCIGSEWIVTMSVNQLSLSSLFNPHHIKHISSHRLKYVCAGIDGQSVCILTEKTVKMLSIK